MNFGTQRSVAERFGPLILAVISVWFLYYCRLEVVDFSSKNSDVWTGLYGATFDMATFFAGSLFSVYVLALSRMEGFLGRIFYTQTFRLFNRYVGRTIAASILLSGWSAYHAVFGPSDVASFFGFASFGAWIFLVVFTVASVLRVMLLFMIFVHADRSSELGKPIGQAS